MNEFKPFDDRLAGLIAALSPVSRRRMAADIAKKFVKLRTNRFMKATGRDDAAVVEFAGKVQRMAKVHQFGLKDRPNPHSEDIQYPKRQLLGINRKNELLIEGLIAEYLVQV